MIEPRKFFQLLLPCMATTSLGIAMAATPCSNNQGYQALTHLEQVAPLQTELKLRGVEYQMPTPSSFCYAMKMDSQFVAALIAVLEAEHPVGRSVGITPGAIADLVRNDLKAAGVSFIERQRGEVLWFVLPNEAQKNMATPIFQRYGLSYVGDGSK